MNRNHLLPSLLAVASVLFAGSAFGAVFSTQDIVLPHAHSRTLGSFGPGPGQFSECTDVLFSAGQIYVVDHENNRVQILFTDGTYVGEFGSPGGVPSSAPGEFSHPRAIAQDPASLNLYVTDTDNNRVQIFDVNGDYLGEFGSPGGAPSPSAGEFDFPTGIAFHGILNQVFVADRNNNRIQAFTPQGVFLYQFGSPGGVASSAPGEFNWPVGLGIDGTGDVYVTERNNHRVQKFEPTGFFLTQWGTSGTGPGEFNNPIAVEYDGAGHIYVSDWLNHRIQIFDQNGNYLTQLKPPSTGILSGMEGMAFTGNEMYVANGFFNTVEVFQKVDIGQYNSLAESNGDLHLSTYDPTNGDLIYGFRPAGGLWDFQLVAVDGNVGLYTSLAVDGSGNPHISFYDVDTGVLYYATKTTGWSILTVRSGAGDFGRYSSIALDSSGQPRIAYTDGVGETLEYSEFDILNGIWSHTPLGGAGIYSVSLKMDGADHPRIAYMDDRQTQLDEIRYTENLGGGWVTTIVDSASGVVIGGTGYVSLALDDSGNPAISYQIDQSNLRYAKRTSGVWSHETVSAVAGGTSGLFSSLSLDPLTQEPRIAYGNIDGTANTLRYAERSSGIWNLGTVMSVPDANVLHSSLVLDTSGNPSIIYGGSLHLAEGTALDALYMVPNTTRAQVQFFTLVGPGVSAGPPSLVELQWADGPATYLPSDVGTTGPDVLNLEFDLNEVPLGAYHLILQNAAGDDTLYNAIVVYDDPVDLTRATTQNFQERFPIATRPGTTPERIAFASDREGGSRLFIKDPALPDAGTAQSVGTETGVQGSSWSPDGTRIVHDRPDGHVFIVDVGTGTTTDLGLTNAYFPTWSPVDDNLIAFTNLGTTAPIEILDLSTGTPTPVTTPSPPELLHGAPEWSPDGARIAFSARDSLLSVSDAIYTVSAVAGQAAGLTTVVPNTGVYNGSPAWSPDGRWIAFVSDRSGNQDIWIASSNGEQYGLFQLTTSSADDAEPNWSPDGTTLYFSSNRANPTDTDIYAATVAPLFADSDGDFIPDAVDSCSTEAPVLGETDRDGDGCPDLTGSFRFMRFWSDDQLPVTFETDAIGDSTITDDSEFAVLDASFATWTQSPVTGTVIAGGDDGTRSGLSDAVSGDTRNSVVFHDPDGYQFGTIALTLSTVAVDDTLINGRWYRPGEIVDADLLFNTFHYEFSTPSSPGSPSAFNLGSVATHEFGHFWGLGHAAIPSATMFYVVRKGADQESLEDDDVTIAQRGYATAATPWTVEGRVLRGEDGVTPVVGAAVFAISDVVGDSLQMTVTGLDGTYRFFFYGGAPSFRIAVHPLDGSPAIHGLLPRNIHGDLVAVADDDFLPEYWDGAGESNSDNGTGTIVTSTDLPLVGADIITNLDTTPPMIVSTFPAEGDTIPATSALSVRFDDRIEIGSVTNATFALREAISSAGVAGTAGLLQEDSLLVFQPDTLLAFDTEYRLQIGAGITDRFGNAMPDTTIVTFRTEVQPPATISALSPSEVPVGGTLVIHGTGYSPTASANEVFFTGGVTAFPYAATLEQLTVIVPTGAQSGSLYVEVNGGAETSNGFPLVVVPPRGIPVGTSLGSASLGGTPRTVTVTPDGVWAYVAHASGVTAVKADPAFADFLTNTAEITLPGGSRGAVALPDGSRVLAISSSPPALQAIDADTSSILLNTVIPGTTVPLPAEPLGIASVPGGGHVLIAYDGRVVMHVAAQGALFGQAIREWTSAGVSFTGDLSVNVDAGEAYATTTDGRIAVLGLGTGEGVVALLGAGPSPRETAGRPDAQRFLAVGEDGTIREYQKRGPLLSSTSAGGGYTGLTLTPDGGYGLAANFILNKVDVFDLTASTPAAVSSIPTGIDPTDITTGGGGRYLYVTTAGSDELEVYDTETGPVITNVFPKTVPGGGLLTVIGTGLGAGSLVNFSGVSVAADSARSDSTALVVRVPDTAPSGTNPLSVMTDGQTSNTVTYKRVDRMNEGNLSVVLTRPMPTGLSVLNVAETADGRYLITTDSDGSITVVPADPSQDDFLRPVQTLLYTTTGLTLPAGNTHELAMGPDGSKFYGITGNSVGVFDVVPGAAAPVTAAGKVIEAGGGDALFGPENLAMTPDGKRLLAVNVEAQAFYTINTENDSLEGSFAVPSAYPGQLAVHPNGSLAFVGNRDFATGLPQIRVVDLNEDSPTYGQTVDSVVVALGGTGGWSNPIQMLPTPDGTRLLVLTLRPIGTSGEYEVTEIDIDPASAGFLTQIATHSVAIDFEPVLALNHSGTILFSVNVNGQSLDAWNLASWSVATTGFYVQFGGSRSACLSLDDGRLYTGGISPILIVADVTGASGQSFVSGTSQTGVVNQPLAAPIVAQLTSLPGGNSAEGAIVTWSAAPASGHFGWPDQFLYTAADADGFADAMYTAGGQVKTDSITVATAAGTANAYITVVGDPSSAPLQLLGVLPSPTSSPGVSTTIAADFSKAVNPASVSTATFGVHVPGGSPVAGVYTAANGNTRIVFRPNVSLDYGTTYAVDLTVGLQDASANPLSNPGTFNFTTAAAPAHPVLNSITTSSAVPGNSVVLAGTGFAPAAADNQVTFGGGAVSAVPVRGGTNSLTVVVPYGAPSGDLQVIANPLTAPDTSNARSFTVLPSSTAPVTEIVDVVDVPYSGQQIAVLPDGSRSYMTSAGANTVVPVNLATGASESAIAVGQHPFGVAAGPNSQRVYATNYFSNTLSVIATDPDSANFHRVIATIPTGVNPTGVAVHPDGYTVYVVNYGDSTVSMIDTDPESGTAFSAKATISTNETSKTVAVTPDGLSIVLGTSTGLLVLDAVDGSAKESIGTGKSSKVVALTPDGAYAVVLTDDDYLLLIDIQPGTPDAERAKSSVNTGKKGDAIALSPDGAYVYVTTDDNEVLVYGIVTLGAGAASPDAQTGQFGFQLIATIPVGENPIGMAVDYTTNTLLVVNSGDNTITFINISGITAGPAETTLDMDPNSLNLKSKGKSVNAALQFPTYLNPADLVLESVLLNGTLSPDTTGFVLLDKNGDGIDEAHVKFFRTEVYQLLPPGDQVPVVVTGTIGTRTFTARDTIRVFRPKLTSPAAGSVIAAATPFDITWDPPQDGPAHHIDIFWSGNLGTTWDTVVVGTEDDSSYAWTAPDVASDECVILLVARDSKDAVSGIALMDDPFVISRSTGLEQVIPARFALLPASPNPFGATTNLRFDLPEPAQVSLKVFGLDGSLVRTLADDEPYPAGKHAVAWDGRNALGQRTSGGVYFVRIQTNKNHAVQKVVRLRR